jgi:hypothetical protein
MGMKMPRHKMLSRFPPGIRFTRQELGPDAKKEKP